MIEVVSLHMFVCVQRHLNTNVGSEHLVLGNQVKPVFVL